ncbi:putative inner membrane component of ABC transporter [Streptococcus pneumoniae]|nr:putative inner membrane component of ABC transporter [Streptococcus pneumoniae]
MITGTAFILIMSLSVRRLPYTIRSSVASLQQIAPSIEEAAESLGSSRLNTFAKITTPMMLSGIISGAILGHNDFKTLYFYPPLQCQNKNNDCSYLYRGSQRKLWCSRSLVNYPDCSNSRFLALVYENL